MNYYAVSQEEYLSHFGIKGMKWGIRKAAKKGARGASYLYNAAKNESRRARARAMNKLGDHFTKRNALKDVRKQSGYLAQIAKEIDFMNSAKKEKARVAKVNERYKRFVKDYRLTPIDKIKMSAKDINAYGYINKIQSGPGYRNYDSFLKKHKLASDPHPDFWFSGISSLD